MPSTLSIPVPFAYSTTQLNSVVHALDSTRCITRNLTHRLRLVDVRWRQQGSLDWATLRKKDSPSHICLSQAPKSSEATAADNGDEEEEESAMGLATFDEFVQLNSGSWGGHFLQFDILGRTIQQIPTSLNIKQALSKTSVPGEIDEPTWAEYKLDESNLSTVDRPQQTIYFPGESAYCVSHQTAEMLNKVLRAGVLGEDDDEKEEIPKIKLPSRRPALVNESCLYSEDGNRRVRAFIVLDPRGLLDVIGVFGEEKIEGEFFERPSYISEQDASEKVDSLVGKWAGAAVTRRTGIYGSSTVVDNDVSVRYEKLPGGFISQEFTSSRGFKVNLTGQIKGSVLNFEGGLQTILLPGGIALSAPISVGRSVGRSQSFFFEFSWIESPGKRRRLVRTYDTDGLVVSTTLSSEYKL